MRKAAVLLLTLAALVTPAINASRLAPIRAIDDARSAFASALGVTVPRPSVAGLPCVSDGLVTATMYKPLGDRRALLSSLVGTPRGTSAFQRVVLRPSGVIGVAVYLLMNDQTIGPDAVKHLSEAQDAINAEHLEFAHSRGLKDAIVRFANRIIVVPRAAIAEPRVGPTQAEFATIEALRLLPTESVTVAINIDPASTEGAFTRIDRSSIYVGNFNGWRTPLRQADWRRVARVVYHHEFAHLWGWPAAHDWADNCPEVREDPFIVSPELLGWTDTDGDGVPEILDGRPYGLKTSSQDASFSATSRSSLSKSVASPFLIHP